MIDSVIEQGERRYGPERVVLLRGLLAAEPCAQTAERGIRLERAEGVRRPMHLSCATNRSSISARQNGNTHEVVCLQISGLRPVPQAIYQAQRQRSASDVPTNCGSPA